MTKDIKHLCVGAQAVSPAVEIRYDESTKSFDIVDLEWDYTWYKPVDYLEIQFCPFCGIKLEVENEH